MSKPQEETFVLWVEREPDGNLTGSVEHIADSNRREFKNIDELEHLLAQALTGVPPKDEIISSDRLRP